MSVMEIELISQYTCILFESRKYNWRNCKHALEIARENVSGILLNSRYIRDRIDSRHTIDTLFHFTCEKFKFDSYLNFSKE